MSFQKCPICNGSGENYQVDFGTITTAIKYPQTCKTCKGTGIISEVTGLPPVYFSDLNEPNKKKQK